MRKRDMEKFAKLLEEKRETLLDKSARTADEGRAAVVEGGEDYVDDAVTHYTREFLLSLSDLDRRQLIMVDDALTRVREGTFGECQMCGDEINPKRLQAIPWARHCVRCQELAEREELSEKVPRREIGGEEE
jgi:DnaK suppressor protein